jgi:hypothetical protein
MTTEPLFSFNVPDWQGAAVLVGELWRLRKGRRSATCALWNHPTRRVELRCIVDDEIRESRADHDGLALLDLAEEWKRQFHQRGWQ